MEKSVITDEEFKESWEKRRRQASLSPLGQHVRSSTSAAKPSSHSSAQLQSALFGLLAVIKTRPFKALDCDDGAASGRNADRAHGVTRILIMIHDGGTGDPIAAILHNHGITSLLCPCSA